MTRPDRMKRGSGIKGRDDRSSGIEIRIAEALAKFFDLKTVYIKQQFLLALIFFLSGTFFFPLLSGSKRQGRGMPEVVSWRS